MATQSTYFKFRNRFEFSPYRYDLGQPIFQNRVLEDNFFLLKIYDVGESENNAFYQYQLDYYLKTHPSQEEAFFQARLRRSRKQDNERAFLLTEKEDLYFE